MPIFTENVLHAVESAKMGFAQLDANECFEDMNPAYAAALGRTSGELMGKSWRLCVHPEDHVRAEEAYWGARKGAPEHVEVRELRADESIIFVVLSVTRRTGENGELIGFNCLRHDISGFRSEQEALALAVESAPNGLLMLGDSGIIQMVNGAVERLFGYSRQELIGQKVEALLPERVRERHRGHRIRFDGDHSLRAMAGRDLTGRRKDGVEIPLQVYLNIIDAPAGKLILCTIIDIAERVQYQRQLELAKRAAESANRAKSDFLARMSHEIRTPMNLIMGMNALLLESDLSDKQRQHVEIAHRNVRRLLRLINGILDLSKVEAGKLMLDPVPFDLHEVLAETVATMSGAVEQKGLALNLTIEPAVWPYWVGDHERLQQILLNLIGNAVKFTAIGKIDLRVVPAPPVDGVEGIQVEVSDTGCGLPSDRSHVFFEAFEQGDDAMNRSYEGTGLGLAIAKTLVEMMGGTIRLSGKEGVGAVCVFTAYFERATPEAVRQRSSDASRRPKKADEVRTGTRILVAEDNPENVVLLRAYLEGVPVVLDFAPNGSVAVAKRCANQYDLVLMDIQMPVMDGYTATREIRAWEIENNRRPVSIVALTAHALAQAAAESRDAGCDWHLTKPVERDDLIDTIARFATQHEPEPIRPSFVDHASVNFAPVTYSPETRKPQTVATPLDDDPMAELRPEFLAKRRLDVTKVRQALEAGDFETAQNIGHNCKGIGKGYGFPEVGLAGAVLERAARARDLDALGAALTEFATVVESASLAYPSVAYQR